MVSEIDRNFYCVLYENLDACKGYDNSEYKPNPVVRNFPSGWFKRKQKRCERCHRKHPTPKQYKEEYGDEVPDDFPVWVRTFDRHGGGIPTYEWVLYQFQEAKRLKPGNDIVCACTPFGKPLDEWRPK